MIWRPSLDLSLIFSELEKHYGKCDVIGPFFSFSHTTYYAHEMGPDLQRCFVAVEQLYDPESLAQAKVSSVALEDRYRQDGKRCFNLDPGILFLHNIILLSTKNFAHRIPLGSGIYAEVTMLYQQNSWVSLPWTFPDYATVQIQHVLSLLRQQYYRQLGLQKTRAKEVV